MELSYTNNPHSLFRKYAKLATWFANTYIGRSYLDIPQNAERIVTLSPNSFHQLLYWKDKDEIFLKGLFFANQPYWKKLGNGLIALDFLTNTYGKICSFREAQEALLHYLFLRPQFSVFPKLSFTVTNFNTGAGDGRVALNAGNPTWATVRDAASGDATSATGVTADVFAELTGGNYYISRIFLPTDTSALTADATLTAAVVNYVVTGLVGSGYTLHVVVTSQASPTTLVNDDYNNLTFTSKGNGLATSTGAKTITISDLTIISKTGTTLIGLIAAADLNNAAPADESNETTIGMSENVTQANRPYIEITYTLPAAAISGYKSLLGVGQG